MNVPIVAAEIARRIPEMAKDSPINNATVIENIVTEHSGMKVCCWTNDKARAVLVSGCKFLFADAFAYFKFCPMCGGRIVTP